MTKKSIEKTEKQQDESAIPKKQQNILSNNRSKRTIKRIIYRNCPLRRMDFKYYLNINDTFFINQQTLKDCDSSDENIQRAMFRYKMISKIVLNSSFVGLELKKVDQNYLPPEYFFQRFRSFGDQQIADIANDMQKVYNSYKQNKKTQLQSQQVLIQKNHQAIQKLNDFLKQMDGKMYVVYFVQICKRRINLKHIFFSVPLLQKLGWNIKRVAMDFLKYRHVFFQIFSPKNYKKYIQMCFKTFIKAQQVLNNPNFTLQERTELTTVYFDDEVIREVETESGIYEEFLKVKVKFFFPHSSFCCVQILKIEEDQIGKIFKKRKSNQQIIQVSAQEQLFQLKSLGFESAFLELGEKLQVKD